MRDDDYGAVGGMRIGRRNRSTLDILKIREVFEKLRLPISCDY
jgi:hypothetical protein